MNASETVLLPKPEQQTANSCIYGLQKWKSRASKCENCGHSPAYLVKGLTLCESCADDIAFLLFITENGLPEKDLKALTDTNIIILERRG